MYTETMARDKIHKPEESFIKQLGREAKNHIKILKHSGRTDGQFGHRDLQNRSRLGEYHFHHTRGPHLPCCRGQSSQNAYIINPYTGRAIALGRPYIFRNREFFSINLVSRALTVWDTRGATLSLITTTPGFDSGGSFSACKLGESSSVEGMLGERFSFVYPTWPLIGTIRNNTFFHADGDMGGRLELLSHTTRAELDPDICYAYISLETLREHMVSGNFFTSFASDSDNVWHFAHTSPLREIITPREGESFRAGDTLAVRAVIQDVREADLIINGQTVERRTGLSGRNIVFIGHQLTEGNVGNTTIGITARNGHDADVHIPSVRIIVSETPKQCNMMENIARDTTLEVRDDARRNAMVVAGQALLNEGYEPAFVAGMLANIMREGSFGQFEDSYYVTDPSAMPQYLIYFVDNHNYTERFSNRIITDVDATLLEIYNMVTNAPGHGDSDNIFGLGIFQWTNRPRILSLLRNYRAVAGDAGISMPQVEEAETQLMISELASGQHVGGWGGIPWGADLRLVWRFRNNDIDTDTAAGDAGYIITRLYTRPFDHAVKAVQRRTDAADIFRVMMQ